MDLVEAAKDTIKHFDVNISDQEAMDFTADWSVSSTLVFETQKEELNFLNQKIEIIQNHSIKSSHGLSGSF